MRQAVIILFACLLFSSASANSMKQHFENILTKSSACKATPKTFKPIDPALVSIDTPPCPPYEVIGEVKVSRYNIWGIKRQYGVITDLMRKQAAELGGNDLYKIHLSNKVATAEIIRQGRLTQ